MKRNHTNEVKQPQVEEIRKDTLTSGKNANSKALKECPQCNFKSVFIWNFQRHVLGVHEKVKDHHCTLCDYETNRIDSLKIHNKSVHDKINYYHCALCDYKTSRRSKSNSVSKTSLGSASSYQILRTTLEDGSFK